MTWTMSVLEEAIIDRAEGWFDFLTWNKTADGTNTYAAGPIRDALLMLEYAVTSYAQPVDADLALVATSDNLKLLEFADLVMHLTIHSSVSQFVDIQVAQRDEKLSQMAQRLEMQIFSKEKAIQSKYGLYYARPVSVKLNHNMQTKADDPDPTNA